MARECPNAGDGGDSYKRQRRDEADDGGYSRGANATNDNAWGQSKNNAEEGGWGDAGGAAAQGGAQGGW